MIRRKNPGAAASRFAGGAFRELTDLKRTLQSAEASLAHFNRNLSVAAIKPPRGHKARTVTPYGVFIAGGAGS